MTVMTEPMIIVYQAVNLKNGKRYIGMTTKGLRKRRGGHNSQANAGNQSSISRAIRKYGMEAFQFSVMEECENLECALDRERALIAEKKPEYNIAAGGLRGSQGWKHSEESRLKMRESHIGKPGPWRGRKRSRESIEKMVQTRALNPVRPWLGKKRSPETIEKMKKTKALSPTIMPPPSPEQLEIRLANMRSANEKRKRKVIRLSDGKIFSSANEASAFCNVSRSSMHRACTAASNFLRGQYQYVTEQ